MQNHASNDPKYAVKQTGEVLKFLVAEGLVAAMPFILIFILLLLTSVFPAINGPLASIKTSVPIYPRCWCKPYTFVGLQLWYYDFYRWLLLVVSSKSKSWRNLRYIGATVKNLKFTYLTIITVVMTAKLMTYSGMTADIAKQWLLVQVH